MLMAPLTIRPPYNVVVLIGDIINPWSGLSRYYTAMSTNGGDGPDSVKVIRAGILIEKSLEGGGSSPVPRVRFDLISKRDEPVTVQFVDRLPESLSSDQVVVDPDSQESYAVGGPHSVIFEAELQPGREYVTHYTVREPTNGLEGLLQAPQIKSVEPIQTEHGPPEPDRPTVESEATDEGGSGEPAAAEATGIGSIKSLLFQSEADEKVGTPTSAPDDADEITTEEVTEPEIPPVTTTLEGVTVSRTVSLRQRGLVATILIATTDIDEPLTVQAVDRFPAELDIEEIAFHPEYEPSAGKATDASVRVTETVPPGEDVEIKYGATLWQTVDRKTVRRIQTVQPLRFELVEDGQPTGRGEPAEGASLTLDELFGVETDREPAATGSDIIGRMVRAIEQDRVSQAQLEDLRDALTTDEIPGSIEARLRHIESRVSEFDAYAMTLQGFLDEHGQPSEAFAELGAEIEEVQAQLERGESRRAELQNRLAILADDLERVDEEAANRVRRLRDRLESIETVHEEDLDEVRETLGNLQADLADLQEDVEAGQDRWEALAEVID